MILCRLMSECVAAHDIKKQPCRELTRKHEFHYTSVIISGIGISK